MVSKLMINWGHKISKCRTLQSDLVAYIYHVKAYQQEKDPLKDFLVALHGTKSKVASVYGDYSSLMAVAKVCNGGPASMANYAGGQSIPREVLVELHQVVPELPNLPPK